MTSAHSQVLKSEMSKGPVALSGGKRKLDSGQSTFGQACSPMPRCEMPRFAYCEKCGSVALAHEAHEPGPPQ